MLRLGAQLARIRDPESITSDEAAAVLRAVRDLQRWRTPRTETFIDLQSARTRRLMDPAPLRPGELVEQDVLDREAEILWGPMPRTFASAYRWHFGKIKARAG